LCKLATPADPEESHMLALWLLSRSDGERDDLIALA
jgi:hypothetical protein